MGERVIGNDVERFWSYVVKGPEADDCWLWTGAISDDGYGRFWIKRDSGQQAVPWGQLGIGLPTYEPSDDGWGQTVTNGWLDHWVQAETGDARFTDIDSANNITTALDTDGHLWSWGQYGGFEVADDDSALPQRAVGDETFTQVDPRAGTGVTTDDKVVLHRGGGRGGGGGGG